MTSEELTKTEWVRLSGLRFYQLHNVTTGERFTAESLDGLNDHLDRLGSDDYEIFEACPADGICTLIYGCYKQAQGRHHD